MWPKELIPSHLTGTTLTSQSQVLGPRWSLGSGVAPHTSEDLQRGSASEEGLVARGEARGWSSSHSLASLHWPHRLGVTQREWPGQAAAHMSSDLKEKVEASGR